LPGAKSEEALMRVQQVRSILVPQAADDTQGVLPRTPAKPRKDND
jgi:hypothetical protein